MRICAAGDLLHLVPTWQAQPLPVYLLYTHARFYPTRLRLFLEAMRGAMPGLVGMRGNEVEPIRVHPGKAT